MHQPHLVLWHIDDQRHAAQIGDGEDGLQLSLRPGLTALVGENDAGKSAVIDAIRFALGTTDQEWYRLDDADFHVEHTDEETETRPQIRIGCRFENLTEGEQAAFLEYLTYPEGESGTPSLHLNWTTKAATTSQTGREYYPTEVRSGKDGNGPVMEPSVRELLRATYLRPLRDAGHALSAGRGSRLSRVLQQTKGVSEGGRRWDPCDPPELTDLSVLGIGELANWLIV